MSSPLTPEERRILELMKALEAQQAHDPAAEPAAPLAADRRDHFGGTLGFDDEGQPFALTAPLPSSEEQARSNQEAIEALEAQLRKGGGPRE
jgi:hypothetical protein